MSDRKLQQPSAAVFSTDGRLSPRSRTATVGRPMGGGEQLVRIRQNLEVTDASLLGLVVEQVQGASGGEAPLSVEITHCPGITSLSAFFGRGLLVEAPWVCGHLCKLVLQFNGLVELPAALPSGVRFPCLHTLDLSHNQLEALPRWLCAEALPALNRLRIDFNCVAALPDSMLSLATLCHFFYADNPLPSVPREERVRGPLAIIEWLVAHTADAAARPPPRQQRPRQQHTDYRYPQRALALTSSSSSSSSHKRLSFSQLLHKYGLAPFEAELQQVGVTTPAQLATLSAEQLADVTHYPLPMIKVLARQIRHELLAASPARRLTAAASPAAALAAERCSTTATTGQESPRRPSSNPGELLRLQSAAAEEQKQSGGGMSAQEKRLKLLHEIVETEISYNAMLTSLLSDYLGPLEDLRALDRRQIEIIFGGMRELRAFSARIIRALSAELQRCPLDPLLASALLPFFDPEPSNNEALALFSPVITKMVQASRLLAKLYRQSAFTDVLAQCSSAIASPGRLGLESLLATPFQRVCRYVLLLKELHHRTEPHHPDAAALARLFACISGLVEQLNDAKRQSDSLVQLDEGLVGNLDALRETSELLPQLPAASDQHPSCSLCACSSLCSTCSCLTSSSSHSLTSSSSTCTCTCTCASSSEHSDDPSLKHRWLFHSGMTRTASRCLYCSQFFRWPKDADCMTCLRCDALVHKLCSRQLRIACQTPSLLNARHRRFTGELWNGLHYSATAGQLRAKPCTALLCSDCLIITEPYDPSASSAAPIATAAAAPAAEHCLVTVVRWWSASKQAWIQIRRLKPKHLLLVSPRDGLEHHLYAPTPAAVDVLSELVQRVEITKLEFAAKQQAAHATTPGALLSLSLSSSTGKPSSSSSSATKAASAVQSTRFVLPRENYRFACNSTTTMPRRGGGGDVIGYVVQAIFDGKHHAVVVSPSSLKQFHRSLRSRLDDVYKNVLTRSAKLPKQRKLYSTAPFRQQKNCRTIAAWFNCLLAIDRVFIFIQEFFDSIWKAASSDVSSIVDSIVDEDPAAADQLEPESLPTSLFEQEPFSVPSLGPVRTCLYNFAAENEYELDAKQGDVFRVLAVVGEWSRVMSVSDAGVIGFVPTNYLSSD